MQKITDKENTRKMYDSFVNFEELLDNIKRGVKTEFIFNKKHFQ